MEPSVKFPVVLTDCGDTTSKLRCRWHYHGRSVLRGTGTKRHHKFPNSVKKPFWFLRRRSKIKLPTRFLLGGTISDPLNLQGLLKERDVRSGIRSRDMNSQVLTTKHSHRIGFPNITDASDPLNLKNVASKEPKSVSADCITGVQERKNASSITCKGMHTLPADKSEDSSSETHCQWFDSSAGVRENTCSCNNSLTLNNGSHCCVQMTDCSINDCKTDIVQIKAAVEMTNNISDEHNPSILSEVEAATCNHSDKDISRDKIVSPAVRQFSRHQARKRRRSMRASTEVIQSASNSHKSACKRIKEKFPCGNYIAYYGYRNVDRVDDPRLQLLPIELFEGKDVLDIGCNAGLVTIAVASHYVPKRILGIDVDQRLIGLAKRNVRRYMDENSYPTCLKSAFGPIATSLLPSTECSAFPHNILFQVVKFFQYQVKFLHFFIL